MSNDNRASYPAWAFRAWHGMTLAPWFALLAHNRFAISPRRATMIIDANSHVENDPRAWQRELFARVPYIQPGT